MAKTRKYPLCFLLPAVLLFSTFFMLPTIEGFFYSFTDWNTYAPSIHFNGFSNFISLFKEGILPVALKNTMLYAFFVTIFVNLFGLILALALNEKLRLGNLYRTIFYIPAVIAPLIVGYIFTAIYDPTYGILNSFLKAIGLEFLGQEWLSNPNIALFSIMATAVWQGCGFCMIIYISGLKAINHDIIEASNVDGANYFQRCIHVIFPMIAPTFTVNFLLSLISSLKVFEIVLVLTQGGPGYSTEVINTFVYRQFARGNWGYSNAASLIQSVLITIVAFVALWALRKREVDA